MEEVLKQILGELKSFNKRFESIENRLDNLDNKMEAVYEQTAGLIEYRTVSLARLEKIESDIEILAGETGKQKLEIERLKKQAI